MQEERLKQRIADRTTEEKQRIYSLRIFINIIVLAILLGCFYSIYRATVFSQENSSVSIRNDTRTDLVKADDYSKRNYCERVKYLNIAPFMQASENAFYRLTIFLVDESRKDQGTCAKKTSSVMSPVAAEASVLIALQLTRGAALTTLPL